MPAMRDEHVARKLQPHDSSCAGEDRCSCDWPERVYNTLLILKTIRSSERQACEAISRVCGSARAADKIRDRAKDDDDR
jgi:hypothetical protein